MARLRPATIYLLHQASQALRSKLEHAFRPLGVTGIQYTILGLLDRHEGLSSADLSRRFFVTPQTMNQIVASLARRNLITRTSSDANKRILEMTLTREGRALLARCERVAEQVESEALATVPAPQLDAMRDQLKGLLRHLRSASGEDARALAELPAARTAGREPATPRRAPRRAPAVKTRDGAA